MAKVMPSTIKLLMAKFCVPTDNANSGDCSKENTAPIVADIPKILPNVLGPNVWTRNALAMAKKHPRKIANVTKPAT